MGNVPTATAGSSQTESDRLQAEALRLGELQITLEFLSRRATRTSHGTYGEFEFVQARACLDQAKALIRAYLADAEAP